MSKRKVVLVLGDDDKSPLVEKLCRFGFAPIVRDDMLEGLKQLRHERFDAVFMDRDHLETDVIEFVLNVRDFDEHIPIIAVGQAPNAYENQVLLKQRRVFVFDNVPYMIYERIESILNA